MLAATMIGGALLATPLAAQVTEPAEAQPGGTATQAEDSIVVTGTRIARPDLQSPTPVNIIGQQEIQLRQANTAEELLRDLPSVRPALGPAVNNGGDGSATIDLRGLNQSGANTAPRTLVLIDGRRVVPFGLDGFVDTNSIPINLVERVDVVTGGASTVYGADAVAGVVNFVTKRNFSGVEASGNYRISGRGDARDYRAGILIGSNMDDDRGNVVLSLNYHKRSPLLVTTRSVAPFPISSATGGFTGATTAQVTIFASPTNAALGLGASNFGAVVNPATGLLQTATAADTYNSNEGTFFQTPLQQWNAYSAAHYKITDDIEIYGSGMFTRNEARIQLAPTGTFGNTYYLPLNNPYLPVGIRNQLCNARGINAAACAAFAAAQGDVRVNGAAGTGGEIPVTAQRRFTELGPRGNPVTSNMFQLQAGFRGDITSSLHFDVSGQYGETRQNQIRENWGSYTKVQQALRAYRTPGGSLVCTDTSNGCVPLNLFGPNGSITPDQLNFINLSSFITRIVRQEVVTGTINGDLFGLQSPFASTPIAFSIGAEYRHISARGLPDAAAQVQNEVLGTGARTPPDFGEYDVKEIFGELAIPIVADKPFIYRLQADGGIRYSDYSTTGTSTTWKAGATYEPIQGFKFRGEYQVAVRSPNINELFQSPVIALGNLSVDPCQSSQLRSAAANPGLAALCVATGAPANTIGNIPTPTSGQIDTTLSGNRNLDVERAKTYTLGAVFTPTFLPRFSATLDYFNIKITDAITTPASGDVLNGCYSAALNPTFTYNDFCRLIVRNALTGSLNAGGLPGVILQGSNRGVIHTAGVDFGVNYRVDFRDFGIDRDIGGLSIGLSGTYLNYYHFQATPNAINRDCTARYSQNCTNPRPAWKYNTRVTYSYGPFDLSLLWTHIGSVSLEPFQATVTQPLTTPQPGGPNPSTVLEQFRRIKAFNYFDLALKAAVGDHVDLTLTVDNLFDKKPPLVGSNVGGTSFNNGNTFPTIYDPIGRAFTFGARVKF